MAATNFIQFIGNTLYGYGSCSLVESTKTFAYSGHFKIAHLYLFAHLNCARLIVNASPLLAPYPLVGRSIHVITAAVGWTLFARFLLDYADATPSPVKKIFDKSNSFLESASFGVHGAILVHAVAMIALKKDYLSVGYLICSALTLICNRFSFIQEIVGSIHNLFKKIGELFCLPVWMSLPWGGFIVHSFWAGRRRANPAELEGYKEVLRTNYIEGLRNGGRIINELRAAEPQLGAQLGELVEKVQSFIDLFCPGDLAVLHEVTHLTPSNDFLEHLPIRKHRLLSLSQRINALAPEKMKAVEKAIFFGTDTIRSEDHGYGPANISLADSNGQPIVVPNTIDLRAIVEDLRAAAAYYNHHYLGHQEEIGHEGYRPSADVLSHADVARARESFGT